MLETNTKRPMQRDVFQAVVRSDEESDEARNNEQPRGIVLLKQQIRNLYNRDRRTTNREWLEDSISYCDEEENLIGL